MAVVILLGTLDTKAPEYRYMKECVRAMGATPHVVDVGVLGEPAFAPDTSAGEVARAAGVSLKSLRFAREGSDTRAAALAAMQRGAEAIVQRLHAEGRCDAVLGAAGSGGSTIISAVMRSLPLGLPKLLVSTMAAQQAAAFVGTRDIAILNSVTDIAGLNRFSRRILRNAACAAAGAASAAGRSLPESEKPLVAITMFGVTTPGVLRVQQRLVEAGFETIVFHAVGTGGRAMEEMIEEGLIDGVIDYTVSELTDELLGGVYGAGPHRLEAAGRAGIPQVVVPGAIEVLNFGARETVPAKYDRPARRLIVHNPYVTAVRTTKSEAVELAGILADKLNRAKGPTMLLLPLRGCDSYQQPPDGPYIDAQADNAFFRAVRRQLREGLECREYDLNINDAAFADAAADVFMTLWRRAPANRRRY